MEGRRAFTPPADDVPEVPLEELLPDWARRAEPADLPEVSEPEIVRHYNGLSKKNFDLDTGFYPLGSCTMKHNPKLHERVAALPGPRPAAPAAGPRVRPGRAGADVQPPGRAGRDRRAAARVAPALAPAPTASWPACCSPAPTTRTAASSRHKVLTPDTAHGTNPATVTMAGYEVVKVGTDEHGGVDIDDLRAKADDDVACLMLTNPNTLGLFDRNIEEIASIVHGVGGTLYYDGANLNAVMGISRPGDMGFDIVHYNLHKTFTQPHGGGGPGAGPIACSDRIEPFLPRAAGGAQRRRRTGASRASSSTTTGPSRSARCAASRATSACSCAPTPTSARWAATACARCPRLAVLNANYLARPPGRGGHREVPADRLRPHLHARVRAVGQGRARTSSASRRSTSPSGCSTTRCTRPPSTSRCWWTRR